MRVLGGSLALLLAAGKVRGFLALLVMVGDSLESCGTSSMMDGLTNARRPVHCVQCREFQFR